MGINIGIQLGKVGYTGFLPDVVGISQNSDWNCQKS